MGYIDDKAREADNTIKGIVIVVVVVIALIAIFGSIEGGITAFAVIMSLAFIGCIFWLVHVVRKENRQNREAAQTAAKKQSDELDAAIRRYNARTQELGFVKSNQLVVWRKFGNIDSYYKNYMWVENGKLYEIIAEPDSECYNIIRNKYDNVGTIKKLYFDIANINYVAIEGNNCVLYWKWESNPYRKDAIEVFRKLIPDKVK